MAFFRANIFLFFVSSFQPNCGLHIHMVLSHWYYYIPTVLSSDSAVGIIIAQGNELYEDGSVNECSIVRQKEAIAKTESITSSICATKLSIRTQARDWKRKFGFINWG